MSMNKLKLFSALAVITLAAVEVSAKSGIEAGYVNTRYNVSGESPALTSSALNGFYVGVSDDIRLVAGLGLRIGLNYSYTTDKSARSIFDDMSMKGGAEKDHYLNVPLRLRYTFNIVPKVLKIQAYAGPVFSVGLSHTYSYDFADGSLKYNYYTGKFKSGALDEEDTQHLGLPQYKRFDVTVGGGIGVELFNFLELKVGYDWGVTDRFKGDIAQSATCNRDMFYAAVGFRF